MKPVLKTLTCVISLLFIGCQQDIVANTPHDDAPIRIILKLDDFRADGPVHPGWENSFAFLNENDVTATIGVIGEGLEAENTHAITWLLAQNRRGHELWNHGYCHCRETVDGIEIREFRGTTFDVQFQSLSRTQQLAKDKLGLSFSAFGAPFNSTDEATALAIASIPDLTVWMFKDSDDNRAPTTSHQLKRNKDVNIEYPVHNPDFEKFLDGYKLHKGKKNILTIQGHPQSWSDDPARFEEFTKIVLFLKSEGVIFTTPTKTKL